MAALAIRRVVESLQSAGLDLSLTPDRALRVKPASVLTPELRELIRDNKPMLLDWLVAANDPAERKDWQTLARVYHSHHFKCAICIAAGQGRGLRCGVGMALWNRSQI